MAAEKSVAAKSAGTNVSADCAADGEGHGLRSQQVLRSHQKTVRAVLSGVTASNVGRGSGFTMTGTGAAMAVDLEKNSSAREILALDVELSEHDRVAGQFRMERTALVNGVLAFRYQTGSDPGAARIEVESRLRELNREREGIIERRNAAL